MRPLVDAAHGGEDVQVLIRAQPRMKTPRIQNDSNPPLGVLEPGVSAAQNTRSALGGRGEADEAPQRCGFSCTVGSQQSGHSARLNLGGKIVEGMAFAIRLRQITKHYGCHR